MARSKRLLKRCLKVGISLSVRLLDALRDLAGRAVGRKPPGRCVVLYYHGVGCETRHKFAWQMDELLRLAKPMRLEANETPEPGRRYVGVTFDDGFVSVLENALPELEKRGIPSTLFVPTGSIGKRPGWVKDPGAAAYQESVADEGQLASLARNPLTRVESHSITHPNFLKLDSTQARVEFVQSREVLERITGRPVKMFSFPHGAHNHELVQMAEQAGYSRVFSINPALAFRTPDEKVIGRVAVDPNDWPVEFRLKVLGAYRWMAA